MSAKRITSWERRRRRRIRVTIIVTLLLIIGAAVGVFFMLSLPYETWDLSQFYTVSFDGYNTEGTVRVELNEEALDAAIATLKADYKDAPIHLKKCSDSDYEALRNSIRANVVSDNHLSNGSSVIISYSYDDKIAEKVNLDITGKSQTITVSGLISAVKISKDEIFKNVNVSFSGISPNVTMTITNINTTAPFIKDIVFNAVEPKEFYEAGETVTIRAFYNKDLALENHYAIDIESEECTMDYTVTSDSAYITDASELPQYVIEEAIASGLNAFTDANEYGVRIFCEAHLVPVYINKQATFEWVSPSFRSAYLKCARSEYAGKQGNHYNDLDIIYSAKITQANGVTCSCYAVVRFSDLVINSDGSITYDFSNPKIMSSDYQLDSIHKTVATTYEGTHTVTKIMSR